MFDAVFMVKVKFSGICHNLQDINNENVHNLDLYKRSCSNIVKCHLKEHRVAPV